MALRVLLADESATIKKVIQISLQDFGVEVKSVPMGPDVLPVCKVYQPDIIFCDVLLAKKNGYEVAREIKNDPELYSVPVILMWSSFMQIDEAKLNDSRADAKLEKPFDADALREIVSQFVPKTQSNPISDYLSFPDLPEFTEEARPSTHIDVEELSDQHQQSQVSDEQFDHTPTPRSQPLPPPEVESFDLLADDDLGISSSGDLANETLQMAEEFQQIPLNPKIPEAIPPIDQDPDNDQWSNKALFPLSKQKITQPAQSALGKSSVKTTPLSQNTQQPAPQQENFASKFIIPNESSKSKNDFVQDEFEEISFDEPQIKNNSTTTGSKQFGQSINLSQIDPDLLENIIREESKQIIENICWKLLPDIIEKVTREEIKKILSEAEKNR